MSNELATVSNDISVTIQTFEKLKEVAEYLAKSDVYTKGFEVKNKAGEIIVDEDGKPKINTADIVVCLMAGNELGLNITGSLLLGRRLNQSTYLSILRGRALGLDPSTALEKVVSIETKNGVVSYTMVDVVSAKLIQGGIEFLPFIKNYAPNYVYYNADNEELELDKILDENDELKPEYALVNIKAATDAKGIEALKAEIATIKSSGKIIVTRRQDGYYSKAKFVRKYPDGRIVTHIQRFSSADARRAGLLPSFDEKGNLLEKGKSNWISNTPQMMNNRVISIGGRIIGADLLQGIYTKEELIDAKLIKEDTKDINAEIVQ